MEDRPIFQPAGSCELDSPSKITTNTSSGSVPEIAFIRDIILYERFQEGNMNPLSTNLHARTWIYF